jgi:hypothetical protein
VQGMWAMETISTIQEPTLSENKKSSRRSIPDYVSTNRVAVEECSTKFVFAGLLEVQHMHHSAECHSESATSAMLRLPWKNSTP